MEAGLLDDRISLEAEYYSKTTTGILLQVPLPNYIGVESVPFLNAADVRNSGFGFDVGYRDKAGPVAFNVSANGSTVENEVLGLGEGCEFLLGGGVGVGGLLATRTEVGSSVDQFYGYDVLGVFQDQAEVERSATRGVQ